MLAFWNRRARTKTIDAEGAKSLVISDDLRSTIRDFGGWPLGGHYAWMYRKQPAVRTVVDFLSVNIASLNPKVYLRIDNADRVEIDGHPLALLLRNPNPTTTRFRFMRDTVADIAIHDVAYWRKDVVPFPRALIRVPVSQMTRELVGTTVRYKGPDGKEIPREQLVIFSGYSPEGAWLDQDGVSPLETLRQVLAEEWEAQQHRKNFWRNAARQAGAIERPLEAPEWSDPARQRFRADWEATMAGSGNAGRTAVLEEGMKWNPDSFSPKDSEYIEGRKLTFQEVCRAYLMQPQLFEGDSANANIEAFHRHLYQDTLGPKLQMLQQDIELQLLPDVERPSATRARTYVEFNLAEKLKGSFEEQGRTLTTAVGVPYMAVNEGRALMNLPRIDKTEFDEPIQPLNVMYGGQPAVTVPTEVPAPKRQSTKKKSAPAAALRRRAEAAKTHTDLFRRYFRAQEQAVAKKADAFDMDRWDAKLAGELYTARVALTKKTGKLAAAQIGGTYDESITLNYLQETARAQAEGINKNTAASLAAEDADPKSVFDIAKGSRSVELGLSTATTMINFARNEAAAQSERSDGEPRTKTWIVTSPKSRHPQLDGETVGISETFSNGAMWPGDISAGVDEVAGCECLLDLS